MARSRARERRQRHQRPYRAHRSARARACRMSPRPMFYVLNGKRVYPVSDPIAWSMAGGVKGLELTEIGNSVVSTIFMGIDHRHFGDGPPLLFETAVISYAGDVQRNE